jgi:uncharacterized membrane protein YfcA
VDIGSFFEILIRLLLGVGIGFTIGMTGIGAGVLVMPSLIYIVGLSPVNAIGTGLLYAMLSRIFGVCEHLRLRTVRKRTALYISIGGIPAIIMTGLIVTHLAKTVSNIDSIMKIVISVVMLMTWTLMLVNLIKRHKDGSEKYYVPLKNFPLRRKLYGVAAGVGVGILVGATSMGGGVLLIPILATVFQLSPNNTVGTSMLVAIVMSATGSFMYFLRGSMNMVVAVTMVLGSIPGVALGCRLSVKVPHKTLRIILFVVVTISVIVMLVGIRR